MANWMRIVESNCKDPRREAEYVNWYKTIHIPDVTSVAGGDMISGELHERLTIEPGEGKFIAVYQIETEDVEKSEAIRMENLQELIKKGRMTDLMEVVSQRNYRAK